MEDIDRETKENFKHALNMFFGGICIMEYNLRSTINAQGFFSLFRKIVCTETQQSIDKAGKHNRCTVFLQALVLLTRPLKG